MRATRRQPRSGQNRPAWPGNAMNGHEGTPGWVRVAMKGARKTRADVSSPRSTTSLGARKYEIVSRLSTSITARDDSRHRYWSANGTRNAVAMLMIRGTPADVSWDRI